MRLPRLNLNFLGHLILADCASTWSSTFQQDSIKEQIVANHITVATIGLVLPRSPNDLCFNKYVPPKRWKGNVALGYMDRKR